MASEWAIVEATKIHIKWTIAQQDYRDATAVLAKALDAARIKGLEEAAEIAQGWPLPLRHSSLEPRGYSSGLANASTEIEEAIRARIKEAKG